MVTLLVSAIATLINVVVSFSTDGNWKTAGLAVTQPYWNRVNKTALMAP